MSDFDSDDTMSRSSDEEPNEEDLMFIVPDDEVEILIHTAQQMSRQLDDLECDLNLTQVQGLGPVLESKRETRDNITFYDDNREEIRDVLLEGQPYVDDYGISEDEEEPSEEWVPGPDDEDESE